MSEKIFYPNGDEMQVGDQVWLDDGMRIGYIEAVLSAEEARRKYLQTKRGFCVQLAKAIIPGSADLPMFYPADAVTEVWKTTDEEAMLIETVEQIAVRRINTSSDLVAYIEAPLSSWLRLPKHVWERIACVENPNWWTAIFYEKNTFSKQFSCKVDIHRKNVPILRRYYPDLFPPENHEIFPGYEVAMTEEDARFVSYDDYLKDNADHRK